MRLVLDTNVLLAAFATRGLCEALLETCITSHEIVLSQHILDELRRHLTRKLRIPARQADETVRFVREVSEIVVPATVPVGACRDPHDLPVLGAAIAAQADGLVTGDRDLLGLGRIEGIPILSPRQVYEKLC